VVLDTCLSQNVVADAVAPRNSAHAEDPVYRFTP